MTSTPDEQIPSDFLEDLQTDPNLQDVTTLGQLREKLAALSAEESQRDGPGSVFQQLTFGGTNPNPLFKPNRFKKDHGQDGVKIQQYFRYAVKDEKHVTEALEYSCDNQASKILELSDEDSRQYRGATFCSGHTRYVLYLGGFKSALNMNFLASNNIKYIINTASNLEVFAPKFPQVMREHVERHGRKVLSLQWLDSLDFEIPEDDFLQIINFIETGIQDDRDRRDGQSSSEAETKDHPVGILIHCAQGRSRSATAMGVYVGWKLNLSMEQANALVKEGRKMADPNQSFIEQMRKFLGQQF
ncbi:hypothetical protein CYMTET_7193 [Cymbomonas tetramitiformis]|uniref:protein-tyrosine-phosphatase n=1 Tax=Cymbomonas tetramitiformis TaxID=36881 RepID=A0AAE0GVY2_9CHLO|nr:hypothetical protein CYMTET_7193 [Cymbomonas tetramitiformis]|eukprot:gene25023-30524_t